MRISELVLVNQTEKVRKKEDSKISFPFQSLSLSVSVQGGQKEEEEDKEELVEEEESIK